MTLPAVPLVPQGWRDIETAPTDGTAVLLFIPSYAMTGLPWVIVHGWNLAADRRGWRSQFTGDWFIEPTHWMPLPEPPK